MVLIRIPQRWQIPEREATPEAAVLDRRKFLRTAGFAGTGLLLGCGLPGGDRGPDLRWSQATERRIDTGEVLPTLPFNGYAAEVAGLYRT